jgi:hypothetical protein
MLPLTEDRAQQYFKLIKPHFSAWVIYKGRFETLAPLYLYVTPPDIFPIELHKTSGIKFENQKNGPSKTGVIKLSVLGTPDEVKEMPGTHAKEILKIHNLLLKQKTVHNIAW